MKQWLKELLSHSHHWRQFDRDEIKLVGDGTTRGVLFVERCYCGAVRTIKITENETPEIRTALVK